MIQWVRLHASTAGGVGLIPGRGTEIPHPAQCGQKKKKKNPSNNPFAVTPHSCSAPGNTNLFSVSTHLSLQDIHMHGIVVFML